MSGIFSLDSKFIQYGNKAADLMLLNLLTVVCSLPLLTVGACFTAMHHVLLKMYRGEECYLFKEYFRAFKNNFRQATILEFIYLMFGGIIAGDYYILTRVLKQISPFFVYLLLLGAVAGLISLSWVFILQSRYENTVLHTIRNSFVVGISQIKYTVPVLFLFLLPPIALFIYPDTAPIVFLIGFSVAGYLQTRFYCKVFEKCENIEGK